MKETNYSLIKGILIGIIITCLLGGTAFYVGVRFKTAQDGRSAGTENGTDTALVTDDVKKKTEQIAALVNYYYLEETDQKQLTEGIYKGIIEALEDPYSVYYDEEETKALTETIDGTYSGIGATMSKNTETNALTVIRCFDGSPAVEAGILPGDIIVTVDGIEVTDMEIDAAVRLIKGEEGTTVELQIYRAGEADYMTKTLTRRAIDIPTVAYDVIEDGIGYIQIASFDKVTAKQFREAYDKLNEQDIQGLVIDLRDNPGGILETVCEIAEFFVPEGLIVYMEDKNGNRTEYRAEGKDTFSRPLAVLVNGNSASASEIFAGAVQDTGVGKVVGTQTYGKGVVQQVIDLQDGTTLKLTISKYFTPNGNDINHMGITPDVEEPLNDELRNRTVITFEEDNQLQKAVESIKAEMGQQAE